MVLFLFKFNKRALLFVVRAPQAIGLNALKSCTGKCDGKGRGQLNNYFVLCNFTDNLRNIVAH